MTTQPIGFELSQKMDVVHVDLIFLSKNTGRNDKALFRVCGVESEAEIELESAYLKKDVEALKFIVRHFCDDDYGDGVAIKHEELERNLMKVCVKPTGDKYAIRVSDFQHEQTFMNQLIERWL